VLQRTRYTAYNCAVRASVNLSDFRDLPRAQPVECSEYRHNLHTELVVFRIDVLKPINQRDIFRTKGFLQCVQFLGQFIDHFVVVLLVGLIDLLTEFAYIAIGLGLDFVAADTCYDFLCVALGYPRLRTPVRWRTKKLQQLTFASSERTIAIAGAKKGAPCGALVLSGGFINRRQRKERKRRLRTCPLELLRFSITSKMAVNFIFVTKM
jgi:hypothetical protein